MPRWPDCGADDQALETHGRVDDCSRARAFLNLADTFDCEGASKLLRKIVEGYVPMTGRIEDLVWNGDMKVAERESLPPAESTPAQSIPYAGALANDGSVPI
jgi:hypothetical protein